MAIVAQRLKECFLLLGKGRLDAADCSVLEQVERITELSKDKNMWVDCECVTSISEEAQRMLHYLASKAESNGVDLVFFQLSPALRRSLREAGLDAVLHLVPDIGAARLHRSQKDNPPQ